MFKPVLCVTCLLLTPFLAHATAVTVDAGSFTATYDTSAFSASWVAYLSNYPVEGYDLAASQFVVSTGPDTLRIDIVQLPPGSNSFHQGADTLLSASGGTGKLSFNLPMTLSATLPASTAYEVTIGTHVSGSAYTPFENSESSAQGIVTIAGTGNTPDAQLEVKSIVDPSGISTPVVNLYSSLFGPNADLSAISGLINVEGAYTKPCCADIRFGIDYLEIKAISTVPEPGTFASMGLGLVGVAVSRRRLG
jgi:hypothetical protein